MGASYTPQEWDAWTDRMKAAHGNGNGHGKSLSIEALRLLPTPTTADHGTDAPNRVGSPSLSTDFVTRHLLPTPTSRDWKDNKVEVAKHRPDDVDTINRALAHTERWGDYAAAMARWEAVVGRSAPEPTEPGPKGNPRLSARFVEFLMGLPEGHVTGAGVTRNEALKALGNGVVPQQAAAATRAFVEDTTKAVAA